MRKLALFLTTCLFTQGAYAQASDLDKIPELPYDTQIIVSNLNMPQNVHSWR